MLRVASTVGAMMMVMMVMMIVLRLITLSRAHRFLIEQAAERV